MHLESFQVVPAVPDRLSGIREMAYNLLWSWDDEIRVFFTRVDRDLWNATNQNPVLMLGLVSQDRLNELSLDPGFMAYYERTYARFRSYLEESTWWDQRYPARPLIAYFSAEFGLAESLPIYSGGLGVLAGHHLKSASDLGVPLVGVGLLYQQGYFRQYLSADGWQQERYPVNDFYNLAVQLVRQEDGSPLRVEVPMAGQGLLCQVWKVEVGRLPLYLLDTNLPENPRELRDITASLYGGDLENRMRQEIVLGIGGMRALEAMGLEPVVCHMNEGHSAFLSLERIRSLTTRKDLRFHEALEATRAGCIFTSHTPVPAGFDVFPPDMMDKYFAGYLREVGIERDELMALGQAGPHDRGGYFNMAHLALRTSAFANGVSRLHGEVSRRLFMGLLPGVPENEVPIGHVTNGAHTRTCVSREMAGLFDRYLGPEWWRRPGLATTWAGVDDIPDEELWATHERRRERLVAFARGRLIAQLEQKGASRRDIERAKGVLDPTWLTIGFARRFATYKRASLILADIERLKSILLNSERPVQIIFAGKAHPHDNPGKEMLKDIFAFCQAEDVRRHVVFLEDYDLTIARHLVQGVDIWLNTPRRGMEASGTSGMKVLPNGGLNLSILDGWWCEGYQPEVGWAIGSGEDYDDHAYQDYVESNLLHDLLENDIVPLFYTRGVDRMPRLWISRMKRSMKLTPVFSTNRMLFEYGEHYYRPAAELFARLAANDMRRAREVAQWRAHLEQHWGAVRVVRAEAVRPGARRVGEGFEVLADVELGGLSTTDVCVELYAGPQNAKHEIAAPQIVPMTCEGSGQPQRFRGVVPCNRAGMMGYTVRVRPNHPEANGLFASVRMTWR